MASNPEQPNRKSSIDGDTRQKLEKRLAERPDKKELIERNVLKDDKGVAPRLIAAREKLERSQLEDKLDHALQQRPKAEELVRGGILIADEAPPA
ncbi:putative RPEL repeat [Lyophyllum shimeji]|uniref:RPEL repeat n=1 Tax=Lyophyllum shimeji TaxID=47721 RepID=A0A9P3PJ92_LYOSH|nr:putative RPEL repeat [Lyophyllum shimeji]